MRRGIHAFASVFRSPRVALLTALGFSSGLPLLLVGGTLAQWMVDSGFDLKTIGIFALVGLPYTFKFAWAPLLDRYPLPFLGRRRGWMLALQLLLLAAIGAMGTVDPGATPGLMALLALVVAFLSASQDIVVDAYRTDILPPHERAAGSATYVTGYRIALLLTSSLALILADHISWRLVYWIFAGLMGVGVIATLLAPEPAEAREHPPTLVAAVVRPFSEILRMRGVVYILLFMVLYKFGDVIEGQMHGPFLRAIEFSKTEIGTLNHFAGFAGTIVGSFIGGGLASRFHIRTSLLAFGVLQALANLLWIPLALTGKSYLLLGGSIFVDNCCNAMGTVAFMAYMMSLCNRSLSATQYALLTSLSSVGKRVFGGGSGFLAEAFGWPLFFAVTAALAIPALLLLLVIPFESAKQPAEAEDAATPVATGAEEPPGGAAPG